MDDQRGVFVVTAWLVVGYWCAEIDTRAGEGVWTEQLIMLVLIIITERSLMHFHFCGQ